MTLDTLLIRPRLTGYHGITLAQEDADFAIPFFDEGIPLHVDPFLMWRSPSMQDNSLHEMLMAAFNHVGKLAQGGGRCCDRHAGHGLGMPRGWPGIIGQAQGKRIGRDKAGEILDIFRRIAPIDSSRNREAAVRQTTQPQPLSEPFVDPGLCHS